MVRAGHVWMRPSAASLTSTACMDGLGAATDDQWRISCIAQLS